MLIVEGITRYGPARDRRSWGCSERNLEAGRPRWPATKEKGGVTVGSASECCRIQKPQVVSTLEMFASEVERCCHFCFHFSRKNSQSGNKVATKAETCCQFCCHFPGNRRIPSRYCVSVRESSLDRAENIHHEDEYRPGSIQDSKRPYRNSAICYAPWSPASSRSTHQQRTGHATKTHQMRTMPSTAAGPSS